MQSSNRLNHIVLSLIDYWYLWIIPCLLGGGLATFYSLFLHTPTYTARQSLIVRDDLMGDAFKPSRFESLDSMKSAQETILEIARKPEVVRSAIEQMKETSSSFFGNGGVSDQEIEAMQGNIEFGAPNGAEFGRTEAVVLKVTTEQRDQAKDFTNLLLDAIDSKLSDVRRQRLKSMQKELTLASEESRKLLDKSSRELQEIERGFGVEITTIRGLNDPQGGNSFDLKLNQIRLEQRQAVSTLASAKEQKTLLENAQSNRSLELVTSSQLLELQPALRGMMHSLNNAREKLSADEGRYRPLHPALKASREAVRHQKEMLFNSLEPAIAGLDSQIAMAESQVGRLNKSIVELENKLLDLTAQRVPYHTLQEEVKNKSKVYSDVQAQLSQIQSYTSSSDNIALLTRVGEPQVGSRPNGLGKKAFVLVGFMGGLLVGLGLVALAVPPSGTNMAYQPVMMPMSGAQAPLTSKSADPMSTRSQSVAQQPLSSSMASVPVAPQAMQVVTETVSESRLKSVAQQEQQRKQTKPEAAPSLMTNALESMIPESVAKHMSNLKNKGKTSPSGGKLAGVAAVAASSAQILKPTSPQKPVAIPESLDSIQNTLRDLDASKEKSRQEKQIGTPEPTIEQPDIVVVERKKTMAPEVPDSIAAGRITAESLIQSSERRGKSQSKPSSSLADDSILPNVKAELEDPNKQSGNSPSQIPSISDYARSLEKPVDEVLASKRASEFQDPSDSTLSMERRQSNVRPIDIAKSLAEHDSIRGIVDDIRPGESDPNAPAESSQRAVEATIPAKVSDNSLAGLMQEARKSAPEAIARKSKTDVSAAELQSASKSQQTSPPLDDPKLRNATKTAAIPQQIRSLTGSISTFARPTGQQSPTPENDS